MFAVSSRSRFYLYIGITDMRKCFDGPLGIVAVSKEGAKRGAIIYTLVDTAKLQGIEPFVYLRDVLSRIADHPYNKLAELLPNNWKA